VGSVKGGKKKKKKGGSEGNQLCYFSFGVVSKGAEEKVEHGSTFSLYLKEGRKKKGKDPANDSFDGRRRGIHLSPWVVADELSKKGKKEERWVTRLVREERRRKFRDVKRKTSSLPGRGTTERKTERSSFLRRRKGRGRTNHIWKKGRGGSPI